ncbi:MAG: hypothetical protein LAT63_04390 [Marinobacter sp.]|nr:hypothetical protein [Marinobacter sp.]
MASRSGPTGTSDRSQPSVKQWLQDLPPHARDDILVQMQYQDEQDQAAVKLAFLEACERLAPGSRWLLKRAFRRSGSAS